MLRNTRRAKIRLQEVGLVIGILACLAFVVFYQKNRFDNIGFRAYIYEQRIQLPSPEVLKFITLGYDNIYANWLWLQSIQAFGSGWRTEDGTTGPIIRYFDTMTEMDPAFIPSYRFGNLVVGDHREDYEGGKWILKKGVHKNPMNYDIPYLGIYNAIWQANNLDDARWFARRIRWIPDTPNFIARMEEYIERSAGRLDIAFEFNVRYFIEYMVQNNEVERQIVTQRMQKLLDDLYVKHIGEAAKRYVERHGEHPRRMEDLLHPDYLDVLEAPTLESFSAAIEAHRMEIELLPKGQEIPSELVESIVAHSKEKIVGIPPDPFGTWYLIWTPAREYFEKVGMDENPDWERLHYIRSARELLTDMNFASIRAQERILEYHRQTGELPPDEELEDLLGRDPLGGHYVYDRDHPDSPIYGVFYSTAAMRVNEGEEPRIGLRGTGPFPFSIEPTLSENPEDLKWGIARGFIDMTTGEERWYRSGQEPDWEEMRRQRTPKVPGEEPEADVAAESEAEEETEQ